MASEFFGLFNLRDPLIPWELAVGRVRSSCDGVEEPSPHPSLWYFNYLRRLAKGTSLRTFIDEFRLEQVRQAAFPHQVSRFKGIFLFDSADAAATAQLKWRSFADRRLASVYLTPRRLTKVDATWISQNLGKGYDDAWMHRYWSGEPHGPNPVFECIVSGLGRVFDLELRRECYHRCLALHPGAGIFLASACAGFIYGIVDAGQCKPKLFFEEDTLQGRIILEVGSLADMDSEAVNAYCHQVGASFHCPPQEIVTTPDMTPYDFDLTGEDAARLLHELESWL